MNNNSKENFWDIISLFLERKKLIFGTFFLAASISVTISLFLPKTYKATALIMPPENNFAKMGISSILSNPLINFGIPGVSSSEAELIGILKSRSVNEVIINKFELMKVYKLKYLNTALKVIRKKVDVEITEESIISISVLDKDPVRAAAIANAYIEELDKKNIEMSTKEAKGNRIFIENRLMECKTDLARAEESLQEFQETHKSISLPEQTMALINEAARIKGEIVKLEVQKGVLLKNLKASNTEVRRINVQMRELEKQLDYMISGEQNMKRKSQSKNEFYVPFAKIPKVALEFARLTRDVKIQETIFEFLTQQYEQAKLKEAKDTPTLKILDKAIPPDYKFKPKRAVFVLVITFLSLFICLFYIWIQYYLNELKIHDHMQYEKIRIVTSKIPLLGKRIK